MLTHISHLGTNTLWGGKTKIRFYVFFSLPNLSTDLTSFNSDLLGPDPPKLVMSGNPNFLVSPLRWHPSKDEGFCLFVFRLWIYRLIILSF